MLSKKKENFILESLLYSNWYVRLEEVLRQVCESKTAEASDVQEFLYGAVKRQLIEGKIPLATTGPDLDKDRKKIDTIVIHHTGRVIKEVDDLSAIGLVRQYGYDYLNNNVLGNKVYGKPIWSSHFMEGKQVFYAYHWCILPDGTVVRMLKDRYIGWHAGNWEINTKSIGIALVGNFEKDTPSNKQIDSLNKVIDRYRNTHDIGNIFPHRAVVASTKCPGEKLLSKFQTFNTRIAIVGVK